MEKGKLSVRHQEALKHLLEAQALLEREKDDFPKDLLAQGGYKALAALVEIFNAENNGHEKNPYHFSSRFGQAIAFLVHHLKTSPENAFEGIEKAFAFTSVDIKQRNT